MAFYKTFAAVLALSFACGAAHAAPSDPSSASLELVQSVPLETTLAVPGVRQAQQVWIEMIHAAQTTLDLEQFYVSDQAGEALAPVIQEIQAASSRGVRVRLLADKKMDATYPDSIGQIGGFPKAESRLIDFSNLGGIQHAKFFVVDGKQSFVGSQNFDWRALSHIHEIGLRVADAGIAAGLTQVFERDWAAGTRVAGGSQFSALPLFGRLFDDIAAPVSMGVSETAADGVSETAAGGVSETAAGGVSETAAGGVFESVGVSIVASPPAAAVPGIPDSLASIVSLMKRAKSSISIQVMEYTTSIYGENGAHWRSLDDAIRIAAKSGVRVQLCVDVSDVKKAKADLKALAALPNIEVRAVTIPAWSGGPIDYARLIHSKYVVIDGGKEGWVGSENWSQGYFVDTRDVGLMVTDAQVSTQLAQVFDRVWGSAYSAKVAP
jgi:phosphatidylserine/phosphatidylglycerophosphate/cardiolipin synthase-like enzyme